MINANSVSSEEYIIRWLIQNTAEPLLAQVKKYDVDNTDY